MFILLGYMLVSTVGILFSFIMYEEEKSKLMAFIWTSLMALEFLN